MLDDLRITWDREDLERSVSSFPLTPNREQRWLDPETFRAVAVRIADGQQPRIDGRLGAASAANT